MAKTKKLALIKILFHKIVYKFIMNYLVRMRNKVDIINLYKADEFFKLIGMSPLEKKDFQQPNFIEYQANETQFKLMIDHVKNIWTDYGNTDPFWSVITSEKFRISQIESAKDEFYHSGENACMQFLESMKRNDINVNNNISCLEFGCGTGRVTAHLAKYFNKVIACDISMPHLKIAEANLQNNSNIEFRNIITPNDLLNIGKVDIFYSVIVLQHNTPPVIYEYLNNLLSILNEGGIAYFQVPTYRRNYAFSINNYINNIDKFKTMEMHAIPQRVIFSLVEKHNCIACEVREDSWVGDMLTISNTFLIQKKRI